MLDTAATFQIPVATSTAKATQATWLNRRAASTATPPLRRIGTSAASTSWPPTQMVAASTCRNSRMVSQLTASIQLLCRPLLLTDRFGLLLGRGGLPVPVAPDEPVQRDPAGDVAQAGDERDELQ